MGMCEWECVWVSNTVEMLTDAGWHESSADANSVRAISLAHWRRHSSVIYEIINGNMWETNAPICMHTVPLITIARKATCLQKIFHISTPVKYYLTLHRLWTLIEYFKGTWKVAGIVQRLQRNFGVAYAFRISQNQQYDPNPLQTRTILTLAPVLACAKCYLRWIHIWLDL